MQLNTYCDISFKENNLACFVASFETCQILYLNDKMKGLLKNPNVLGQHFYDVIKQEGVSFPHSSETGLQFGQYFEEVLFDSSLNLPLRATFLRFRYENNLYILCKYKPTDQNDDLESIDYAITECINILNQEEDTIIPSLLDLLGDFYKCDKSFVYSIDHENCQLKTHSSWVATPQLSIVNDLNNKVDVNRILTWLEKRNEVGIIEADLNHTSITKDSLEYKILTEFDMSSLALSVISDNSGKVTAVIGLVNRKKHKRDYRLFQTIVKFTTNYINNNDTSNLSIDDIQNTDILTGFLNRNAYSNRLELLKNTRLSSIGVIFINVNGLKNINLKFGYAKGDNYIKLVAKTLSDYFTDVCIYRISGDEFVIFFENIIKEDFDFQIQNLQKNMKDENNQLFAVGYTWNNKTFDIFKLVEEADNLMYINKQEYYHTSERTYDDITDNTLSDLLEYIANDEFMVFLQPQFELATNTVAAAEALIRRFDKKNRRMVFPDQFIPMYEQKSVIRHIDIFVVEKVCEMLVEWIKLGKEISIAVNLSRVTLMEYGIVQTISKICDKYKVPRKHIIIEVTERVGLIENDVNTTLIDEFKACGFKVSLDDFGCAYSNIVTLANISVDEVKIDKSLVDNILLNKKNKIIVQSVIDMCEKIGDTHTLAEGIETQEQANILRQFNCQYGQGYLYSRPIPIPEFEEKYIKG